MLLPGGATKSYVYDPLMRVKEILAQDKDSNGIVSYAYDYDRMDNIKNKNTEHGAYDYDYDDLYRLIDVDNPTIDDEGFSYDPVGNRLTSTATTGTWSYNDNNELQGYNGVTFTYDDNGNTIGKIDATTVWTYTYNVEDRMVAAETLTTTAQYYYDPFGRRLWKEVDGIRTYYMYADEGLAAEMDADGTVTKSYLWKPDGIWGTDCLAIKEADQYYFIHNDHLGTPQKITDIDGNISWSATYTAFGSASVNSSSSITCNLRFPGQYFDAETGLHYNFFRYYDAASGRYLRTDPIFLMTSLMPYNYVNNRPNSGIDMMGLKSSFSISFPGSVFPRNIERQIEQQIIYFFNDVKDTTTNILLSLNPMPNASGIAFSGSTVNPFLHELFDNEIPFSNDVLGKNYMYFMNDDGVIYDEYMFLSLIDQTCSGFDVGLSLESVWAWGSGPWDGTFCAFVFGAEFFTGSIFWSPDFGWIGLTFGFSASPVPFTFAYEETYYLPCEK